jgi:hypothetical protein
MKNVRIQLLSSLFVLVITFLFIDLSTSYAQIGNLGIYGSVLPDYRTNARYVHIENADSTSFGYTIPVNGHKNFNFLYLKDGTGFLPGGTYSVSYLDASQSTLASETVNYTPNSGHTNGTQVATAFNDPPSTPRGVHGRIYATIGGVNYLFPNATVTTVPSLQSVSVQVKTNDNGNFFTYYQNGNARAFLPINTSIGYEFYDLIVSGSLNGCTFSRYFDLNADWHPVDPSLSTYFVDWAEVDVGDLYVPANGCGD